MGSKSDKTTTQESSPWEGQQPFLEDLFAQAQGLYQGGPQQYFPGQTVAPFSPQTMQGMDLMTQRALGGSAQQDQLGQYLSNTMGQQNLDPSQIYGGLGGAAGGIGQAQNMFANAGMPNQMVGGASQGLGGSMGYGGLGEAQQFAGNVNMGALPSSQQYAQNQMGVGAAGNQELARTAGGGYLGSNPYLDAMFDKASGRAGEAFNEQTMPALAAQFGSAGRTGGGIHQQMGENATRQFGRDLQGMAADIYSPAYEAERNRMQQAAQGGSQAGLGAAGLGVDAFGQMNQAQLGRGQLASQQYLGQRGLGQDAMSQLGQLGLGQGQLGLQGAEGLGQMGMQAYGQMGDMWNNVAQNQFRGASLVPGYNDMQYGDIQRLMGVGGMQEDQAQRLMGANQDRWNFGQNAPWQNLGNYANTVYGLPGGYGTQTTTEPGGSRLGGMMGGAMSGWGATGNPWGAAAGGILGGFG